MASLKNPETNPKMFERSLKDHQQKIPKDPPKKTFVSFSNQLSTFLTNRIDSPSTPPLPLLPSSLLLPLLPPPSPLVHLSLNIDSLLKIRSWRRRLLSTISPLLTFIRPSIHLSIHLSMCFTSSTHQWFNHSVQHYNGDHNWFTQLNSVALVKMFSRESSRWITNRWLQSKPLKNPWESSSIVDCRG